MGSMIPCYDCFSEDGTIDYGDFSPYSYPCCNCESVKYKGLELPKLTEKEKKEKELVVRENGTEFHFSCGNLVMTLPY